MFGPSTHLLVHLQGVYGEWREDEDDYFDDFDDMLDDLELSNSVHSSNASPIKIVSQEGVCSICLGDLDEENDDHASLKCGHRFCIDCLSTYLIHQIKSREIKKCQDCQLIPRKSVCGCCVSVKLSVTLFWGIKCPNFACNCMIGEKEIESLAPGTVNKTLGTTLGEFLERERIQRETERNHLLLGEWARQIVAKCCPKCFVPIEKNLGCDHMYCIECKHHFLWSTAPKFGTGEHWYRPNRVSSSSSHNSKQK